MEMSWFAYTCVRKFRSGDSISRQYVEGVYLGIRPRLGVSPRGLVSDNPFRGANAPREGLSDTDPRADTKPRI